MKNVLLVCALIIPAMGFANSIAIPFDRSVKFKKNNETYVQHDYGSGVRWNKNYVVSAKHVSFVEGSVYKCSENCDLQFIEMKDSPFPVPEWRDSIPSEKIHVQGNTRSGKMANVNGQIINQKFYINGTKILNTLENSAQENSVVYATTAHIFHGQSGGPVIGEDGKVIGILVGETEVTNQAGKKFIVSVFVPKSVIEQEWKKFNNM